MMIDDTIKLKWHASVEYFRKMDIPESQCGLYAVLFLNHNVVFQWKLTDLDEINIVTDRESKYTPGYNILEINEDGLAEFIAGKLGEIFSALLSSGQISS